DPAPPVEASGGSFRTSCYRRAKGSNRGNPFLSLSLSLFSAAAINRLFLVRGRRLCCGQRHAV
ncbi:hypothetical protein Taro_033622, partial [Colocasia esculenta]|nr:hypothetical protein [Colocasia esculenta]